MRKQYVKGTPEYQQFCAGPNRLRGGPCIQSNTVEKYLLERVERMLRWRFPSLTPQEAAERFSDEDLLQMRNMGPTTLRAFREAYGPKKSIPAFRREDV